MKSTNTEIDYVPKWYQNMFTSFGVVVLTAIGIRTLPGVLAFICALFYSLCFVWEYLYCKHQLKVNKEMPTSYIMWWTVLMFSSAGISIWAAVTAYLILSTEVF